MTKRKNINLQLDTIADGSLNEKFQAEMKQVLKNLMDPNTSPKDKRKISINLIFTTNDQRSQVETEVAVKSALAAQTGFDTTILMGMNTKGEIVANELKSGTAGQTYIGVDGIQRDDTGRPIDEVEQEQAQPKETKDDQPTPSADVINLRNQNKA